MGHVRSKRIIRAFFTAFLVSPSHKFTINSIAKRVAAAIEGARTKVVKRIIIQTVNHREVYMSTRCATPLSLRLAIR